MLVLMIKGTLIFVSCFFADMFTTYGARLGFCDLCDAKICTPSQFILCRKHEMREMCHAIASLFYDMIDIDRDRVG